MLWLKIRLFVDDHDYVTLPGLIEDESEDSDEVAEQDLTTSCTRAKAVPVLAPKQGPKEGTKSAPI